jgi:hypothetical protein
MAGGVWTSPVDVGVEAVPTTLLTNIADDLRCLRMGNSQTSTTALVPDANTCIDIGATEQVFNVDMYASGTSHDLYYISTTGRAAGNIICLRFIKPEGSYRIYNNGESAPAGYSKMLIYGGANSIDPAEGLNGEQLVLLLLYNGTNWNVMGVFA